MKNQSSGPQATAGRHCYLLPLCVTGDLVSSPGPGPLRQQSRDLATWEGWQRGPEIHLGEKLNDQTVWKRVRVLHNCTSGRLPNATGVDVNFSLEKLK